MVETLCYDMATNKLAELSSVNSNSPSLAEEKHDASLLLIKGEFEKCIEVCRKVLNNLKPTLNSHDYYEQEHRDHVHHLIADHQ